MSHADPTTPARSGSAATADHRPTVVVVGAGIAGLAAAWTLATSGHPLRLVVLEGSTRVGGKLALADVGDVQVDVGAESLLARRPEAVDLVHAVGLGHEVEAPRPVGAALWTAGALRPLPTRTLMGVPSGGHGLAGLLTDHEIAAVLAEPRRSWPPVDHDVDVASFIGRRLGPAVVDRLVEPLLGGVYAGRADRLSLQATMPGLWPAALHGHSLVAAAAAAAPAPSDDASAPAPVFAGIRGGVGRLPLALAAALRSRGVDLRAGATVRRLERSTAGWRVVHGPAVDEQVVEADGVVLAVPGAPASRLLAGHAPDAARALADVPYASMAVVTLALGSNDLPPTGSGFLVPPVEGLRVKAATFSSVKWGWLGDVAGDRLVLRASLGRIGQEDELQHDDDELVQATVTDLRRVLGDVPAPTASLVTRWGGGVPQYTVGHLDRVAAVRRDVARSAGLSVCGAAYDGVGVPACIASARRAADDVLADLLTPATRGRVAGGGERE